MLRLIGWTTPTTGLHANRRNEEMTMQPLSDFASLLVTVVTGWLVFAAIFVAVAYAFG